MRQYNKTKLTLTFCLCIHYGKVWFQFWWKSHAFEMAFQWSNVTAAYGLKLSTILLCHNSKYKHRWKECSITLNETTDKYYMCAVLKYDYCLHVRKIQWSNFQCVAQRSAHWAPTSHCMPLRHLINECEKFFCLLAKANKTIEFLHIILTSIHALKLGSRTSAVPFARSHSILMPIISIRNASKK